MIWKPVSLLRTYLIYVCVKNMTKGKNKKRIIIFGSTASLGKAVSKHLNGLGYLTVLTGRNFQDIKALQNQLPFPENSICKELDFEKDLENIAAWMKSLVHEYGKIDGFVSLPAIQYISGIKYLKNQIVETAFRVNVFANIEISKAFSDKRINNGRGGSAVFITSTATKRSDEGLSLYSSTKSALNTFVKVYAKEIAKDGLRANTVCPGLFVSTMTENHPNGDSFFKSQQALYPLGLGKVDDIVEAIGFLLSEKSKWITGSEIVVDGGYSA